VDFYPSISEKLLNEALACMGFWFGYYIYHRKRYFNNKTCMKISTFRQRQIMDKKYGSNSLLVDVSMVYMGSFDGAEIC
jgi:hypothetical protein